MFTSARVWIILDASVTRGNRGFEG